MLNGALISLIILGALSLSDLTLGRMLWPERDGRVVTLNPRRFGQQNPPVTVAIGQACQGGTCGVLSGKSIVALLANAGPCDQQNVADAIINASKAFDPATQQNMVKLAVEYCGAERNSPPDFTKNPPINRNTLYCQNPPQNPELNCCHQAQDPNNNPNVFFSPKTGGSVLLGSEADTFPFCQNHHINTNSSGNNSSTPPSGNTNTTQNTSTSPSTSPPPSTVCTSKSSSNGTSSQGNSSTPASNGGKNLQTFTGSLGATAPSVTQTSDGEFQVENNAIFKQLNNACQRSCDVQHNQCADAANSSGNKGNLTVAACGMQQNQCSAVAQATGTNGPSQNLATGTTGTPGNQTDTTSQISSTGPSSQGNSSTPASNGGKNLQTFTGSLGATAPSVTQTSDGEFQVENNASFKQLNNARQRSCDVQHNQCADAANSSGNKGDLTVAACGTQQNQCSAVVAQAA